MQQGPPYGPPNNSRKRLTQAGAKASLPADSLIWIIYPIASTSPQNSSVCWRLQAQRGSQFPQTPAHLPPATTRCWWPGCLSASGPCFPPLSNVWVWLVIAKVFSSSVYSEILWEFGDGGSENLRCYELTVTLEQITSAPWASPMEDVHPGDWGPDEITPRSPVGTEATGKCSRRWRFLWERGTCGHCCSDVFVFVVCGAVLQSLPDMLCPGSWHLLRSSLLTTHSTTPARCLGAGLMLRLSRLKIISDFVLIWTEVDM